ncbi:zinc-binding dehydrogenase [Ruixingdingia sedimenti]|uniref:Zinc-binding dehydrogenase n=1 Tax=Ruixingdingia sedimenti TaxID=3073604 RepID=A0ABU1F3Z4_9RHOB|nr:zinc-binding dehydrogenase [Xinfangfangia sp. LG-4]MDR5651197.1 zinc-binding dehydrogenase [Xinfangfangia sp. LG-4]
MTELMKAGVSSENGLRIAEVPRPAPGPGQVLVKVAAAGMNRADLNAAKGAGVATKGSLGRPIGMEWAGEVAELGQGVTGLRVGDRVMCSGTGGYAEYAVADAGRTIALGDAGFDLQQAAVLPLVLMTAHDAVVTNGRLAKGDAVLVQGASSAVGLMSMQIAALRGARMIAGTSGNAAKRVRLTEFGATHALDPASGDLERVVLDATGGKGVELVVDMVSGASVNGSMRMAAVRGRMVNVGRLGGAVAEFDFDLHAAKRLDYIGVTFRTRSPEEVRAIVEKMKADLWDDLLAGLLRLPTDRSFALADAIAAHDHMRVNAHFGKIVLVP